MGHHNRGNPASCPQVSGSGLQLSSACCDCYLVAQSLRCRLAALLTSIGLLCSGFLRSWKTNGLDERVLQRVSDILTEPGSTQRHLDVTG